MGKALCSAATKHQSHSTPLPPIGKLHLLSIGKLGLLPLWKLGVLPLRKPVLLLCGSWNLLQGREL